MEDSNDDYVYSETKKKTIHNRTRKTDHTYERQKGRKAESNIRKKFSSLLRKLTNASTHENRDNAKCDLSTIECVCRTFAKHMF